MFKSILVALDGSVVANVGFKTALQLAGDQHATLLALHVIDSTAAVIGLGAGYAPATYTETLDNALRKSGAAILDKAESGARMSGVACRRLLVDSRGQAVAQAILQQARKAKADLIVIGTHGRRGLSRMLMGSDAEAVVREAGVPVLLVRSAESSKEQRAAGSKRDTEVRRATGAKLKSSRAATQTIRHD